MRQLEIDNIEQPASFHLQKAIEKIQREVVGLQTAARKAEDVNIGRQIAYQGEIISNAISTLKLISFEQKG